MSTRPKLYEDPTIRECAKHLLCEALDGINRRVRAGDSFYLARTATLERLADEWVTRYGREAADMAVRGLHALAPGEVLDRETLRVQRAHNVALGQAELAAYDPVRNTWINRKWLRFFGRRLYVLALLILAAAPLARPAEAGDRDSHYRALALCGVAKSGTERERACRNFNLGQRGSWRGYDHRGGTPRSWELPRSWEIEP